MIKGLGIGGAERLISEGARHWDRDAFEYHVAYALPWKDQLVADLEDLGVPVHLVGGTQRGLTASTPLALRSLISDVGANLVHAHLPVMGVMARMISPVPVIYTEHNLVQSYRPLTRILNRLTYSRNRVVTAVSSEVAVSVADYPGHPVIVVPNGVEPRIRAGDVDEARREMGLSSEAPLIAHVGNIRPHKGHETLMLAAARLRESIPEATIVSIGGEKRPGDLVRVRAMAHSLGVEGMIRFTGRRDDAVTFIAAADVLVNPSDVEGLPLAVLEAMYLGTPVVATSVGGVPSVIRPGETGLLVEPGDPDSLASAVLEVLSDRDEAQRRSERARSLIEESHSVAAMVGKFEALYREVLGTPVSGGAG